MVTNKIDYFLYKIYLNISAKLDLPFENLLACQLQQVHPQVFHIKHIRFLVFLNMVLETLF